MNNFNISKSTIHHLHIDLPEGILDDVEPGDKVMVGFSSSRGTTGAKMMSYRDVQHLLGEEPGLELKPKRVRSTNSKSMLDGSRY